MARIRTKKLALPPRLDARYLQKKEESDERTEQPSVNNPDMAAKYGAIYGDMPVQTNQQSAPQTTNNQVATTQPSPEPVTPPEQTSSEVVDEQRSTLQMQVPTIAGVAYHEYEVAPAPPPPPTSPAGWYADPSGKHQYRYFDGHDWTEHVANNGVTSIDPPPAH
jgi:hypothetical protein